MNLRHQFIPYLYTMNYRNFYDDLPLILPLYYEYPHLQEAYDYQNEYLFGSEILISAITEKANSKLNRAKNHFFLPDGLWYDFFSGEEYDGNRTYTHYYAMKNYPIFAKAGAIIPLTNQAEVKNMSNPTHLDIHLFPHQSNEFILYEDDNTTQDYLSGKAVKTKYESTYLDKKWIFKIHQPVGELSYLPNNRTYTLKFRNVKKDVTIELNKDYQLTYDEKTKTVNITIENTKSDEEIICVLRHTESVVAKNQINRKETIYKLLLESVYQTDDKSRIWNVIEKNNLVLEKINALTELRKSIPNELIDAVISLLTL